MQTWMKAGGALLGLAVIGGVGLDRAGVFDPPAVDAHTIAGPALDAFKKTPSADSVCDIGTKALRAIARSADYKGDREAAQATLDALSDGVPCESLTHSSGAAAAVVSPGKQLISDALTAINAPHLLGETPEGEVARVGTAVFKGQPAIDDKITDDAQKRSYAAVIGRQFVGHIAPSINDHYHGNYGLADQVVHDGTSAAFESFFAHKTPSG